MARNTQIELPERACYVLRTLREAPNLLSMDRKDRSDFLRYFYRRYEDAPVQQIEEDSQELLAQLIMTKVFLLDFVEFANTALLGIARF